MAWKKQFKVLHLYQNCNYQEPPDYLTLKKAGQLLSDKSNCAKGDMLFGKSEISEFNEKKPLTLSSKSTFRYEQVVAHHTWQCMVNSIRVCRVEDIQLTTLPWD